MDEQPSELHAQLKATWQATQADPLRPRYHFQPPAHWMNDPNGLIQWRGEYHLFYQHNPHGAFWGTMHWGHASSPDLLRWTHQPLAMAPDQPYDKDGCFSGCAVDNAGTPTILYTGVKPQTQCLATSSDGLRTWSKHPANPVIPSAPSGVPAGSFRDPCVWRENGEWRMVVGAETSGGLGQVLLYRSADLVRWDCLGSLVEADASMPAPLGTARMWECPGFFELDGRWVLIVSCIGRKEYDGPKMRVGYMTGRRERDRFHPERFATLDFGSDYYAPATTLDDKGRRLMWGWIGSGRSGDAQKAAGWSGAMSMPIRLSVRPDGRLGFDPAEELLSLRGEPKHFAGMPLADGIPAPLIGAEGDALEIDALIDPGSARRVGLALRVSPDSQEKTLLWWDRDRGRLELDRTRSSLDAAPHKNLCGDRFERGADGPLRLRVFLDRSIIEVFADGCAQLTSTVFPTRADSTGLYACAEGGSARLVSATVRPMGGLRYDFAY